MFEDETKTIFSNFSNERDRLSFLSDPIGEIDRRHNYEINEKVGLIIRDNPHSANISDKLNSSTTDVDKTVRSKRKIFASYKLAHPVIKVESSAQSMISESNFKSKKEYFKYRNKLSARKSRLNKENEINMLNAVNRELQRQIDLKDKYIQELEEEIQELKSKHYSIRHGNSNSQCNKSLMSLLFVGVLGFMVILLVLDAKSFNQKAHSSQKGNQSTLSTDKSDDNTIIETGTPSPSSESLIHHKTVPTFPQSDVNEGATPDSVQGSPASDAGDINTSSQSSSSRARRIHVEIGLPCILLFLLL